MSAVVGGILFILGVVAVIISVYFLVTRGKTPQDPVPWWVILLLIGGILLILIGGLVWFFSGRTTVTRQIETTE